MLNLGMGHDQLPHGAGGEIPGNQVGGACARRTAHLHFELLVDLQEARIFGLSSALICIEFLVRANGRMNGSQEKRHATPYELERSTTSFLLGPLGNARVRRFDLAHKMYGARLRDHRFVV